VLVNLSGLGPLLLIFVGEELGRDFLMMLWVFERSLTRFGDQDVFQKCVYIQEIYVPRKVDFICVFYFYF
jgi:hypothetical protein